MALENRFLRKRRNKEIRRYIIIFSSVLIFCVSVFAWLIPKETSIAYGKVIDTFSTQSRRGDTYKLIVELDNRKTITVSVHNNSAFRNGQRIRLSEITTWFFGLKKYEFLNASRY